MDTNIVVKYKVEKAFIDKNTKEEIKNKIIDIDIERMKVLNANNIGRVVDIIVIENDTVEENDNLDTVKSEENNFTMEELKKLNTNELKDLAEKYKIELTKSRKDEIIKEILENKK